MAEAVVLANVSIDSRGVVSGVTQSNAALASGNVVLNKFGASQKDLGGVTDQLVGRMFSLKSAAITLGRSLGIAGVVISLALAIKTLVTDLIESTGWFKRASATLGDWYNAVIKGETAAQRLSRVMSEISKATGVKFDLLDQQQQLNNILENRSKILDELNRKTVKQASLFETVSTAIGSLFIPGLPMSARAGSQAPDAGQRQALEGALAAADKTAKELKSKIAGTWVDPAVLKKAQDAIKAWREEVQKSIDASRLFDDEQMSLNDTMRDFNAFFVSGAVDIEANAKVLADFDSVIQRTNADTAQLSEILNQAAEAFSKPPEATAWQTFLEDLSAAATTAQLKLNIAAGSMNAFSSAVGQSAASGRISIKELTVSVLQALALQLGAWGALGVIQGFVTHDPVLIGQGFAAIAAGVALGAAARALGGRGAERASAHGGGGGGGGREARGGGVTNQTISVVVQGSVDDPNDFARKIGRLINMQRTDGARA